MPYPQSARPQDADSYAQQPADALDMPPSLRQALEQAAARMVGEDPGPGGQTPPSSQARLQGGQPLGDGAGPRPAALSLPGLQDVLARLAADPRLAAHLAGAGQDDDADDDLGPADFGPPPYDPVERMQWDIAHGVHNALTGARRARLARRQQRTQAVQAGNQAFLNALAQADPLFQQTYALLLDYLNHQPPAVLRQVAPQLNQDPRRFLELYGHMRHFVAQSARQAGPGENPSAPQAWQSAGQGQGISAADPAGAAGPGMAAGGAPEFYGAQGAADPSLADPRAAVRRAVAGRMAAPALENPGSADEPLPRATRQSRLTALKARMNAQGAGPGDLERYLELLGVGEKMLG